MMNKKIIGSIVAGIIAVVVVSSIAGCIVKIKPGYTGVVYSISGGVDGETLGKGWHVVSPTKSVTQYSTSLEQSYLVAADKGDSESDESFDTPTSDGKTLNVDIEFSYKFDKDRIADTFELFKGQDGETIKNTFIKPKISAWTQEVTSKYPVTDVFGDKRQELNEELDRYLKEKFDSYGIMIDTVNFTRIETDSETEAAIQQKVNAQQEQELANIQAKTAKINAEKDKEVARIEAEKNKEVAQINAEQASIKAESDANVAITRAEAEAKANKMVAESLTSELIEMQKYEKWNGELPQITGNATPIVDLGE